MADKKISQLSSASTPLAGTEVLPIVQSGSTVKVASDDLTVKNVRSNATTGILQVAGPSAAATRTMTVPDANFTAARTDAAQTFTGDQTFGTVLGTTFDTNVAAAGVTLSGVTLSADGTDSNININITPKGTGEVALPKVNIDAGAIDGTAIGANSASTGAFSTLSATGNVSFNGGTFIFNDSGADKDFRVEGDTDANLLFADASTDRVGFGTSTPTSKLEVSTSSDVLTTYRNADAKTRRLVKAMTTTSSTPVTIDVDTGGNPSIFTITVNAMSYTGGASYHVYGVGRGYLFSSPGFGMGFSTLTNSGLTCAVSWVSGTTVRVTITDTVSADAKAGVCEIVVTTINPN